jgi:hypothetical protein
LPVSFAVARLPIQSQTRGKSRAETSKKDHKDGLDPNEEIQGEEASEIVVDTGE